MNMAATSDGYLYIPVQYDSVICVYQHHMSIPNITTTCQMFPEALAYDYATNQLVIGCLYQYRIIIIDAKTYNVTKVLNFTNTQKYARFAYC